MEVLSKTPDVLNYIHFVHLVTDSVIFGILTNDNDKKVSDE